MAAELGLAVPPAILLYGDPGTGKSLTARLLAASLPAVPAYELPPEELSPARLRGALELLAAILAHPVASEAVRSGPEPRPEAAKHDDPAFPPSVSGPAASPRGSLEPRGRADSLWMKPACASAFDRPNGA